MSSDHVWARLKLVVAQGVAGLVGKAKVQATFMDDEPLPNIKRVEPYGLSYMPKSGAQVYAVFPSGDRSQGIALIVGDKRYQIELQPGEVALHDDEDNWVKIKRGGIIEAKAATKVIAETPLFETSGNAKIGGNLEVVGVTQSAGYFGPGGGEAQMTGGADVDGRFTVNGKDVGDGHTHTSTSPGSPTSGVN